MNKLKKSNRQPVSSAKNTQSAYSAIPESSLTSNLADKTSKDKQVEDFYWTPNHDIAAWLYSHGILFLGSLITDQNRVFFRFENSSKISYLILKFFNNGFCGALEYKNALFLMQTEIKKHQGECV